MKDHVITITVSGKRQTGKTHILNIINKALAEAGYGAEDTPSTQTVGRGMNPTLTNLDDSPYVNTVKSHSWTGVDMSVSGSDYQVVNQTLNVGVDLPKLRLLEISE